MRALLSLTAVLLIGCQERGPATLVVEMDTLVLNGPSRVALPVRLSDGEPVPALDVQVQPDSIVSAAADGLTCLRAGDARLTILAGPLRESLVVQCRPVVSFAPPDDDLDLQVAGPSRPIPVRAYGPDGRIVDRLRFSASVHDTAVVTLEGANVVPRALGQTRIDLDFGGIRHSMGVTVVEPVATDTVRLTAGVYRSWPLPAGRFRISVQSLAGDGRASGTELGSDRANCAWHPREVETMQCVVSIGGTLVVRAPATAANEPVAAIVRIVRIPS